MRKLLFTLLATLVLACLVAAPAESDCDDCSDCETPSCEHHVCHFGHCSVRVVSIEVRTDPPEGKIVVNRFSDEFTASRADRGDILRPPRA